LSLEPVGFLFPPLRCLHLWILTGLSGIAAAHRIQTELPNKSFKILEGRDSIGGTWDLFRLVHLLDCSKILNLLVVILEFDRILTCSLWYSFLFTLFSSRFSEM
jgi:hypothetical protein